MRPNAVFTEFVSANSSDTCPNCSPLKFSRGWEAAMSGAEPSICVEGVYLPLCSAAAVVTTFIVEPGGKRPPVARLRVGPR